MFSYIAPHDCFNEKCSNKFFFLLKKDIISIPVFDMEKKHKIPIHTICNDFYGLEVVSFGPFNSEELCNKAIKLARNYINKEK